MSAFFFNYQTDQSMGRIIATNRQRDLTGADMKGKLAASFLNGGVRK
jgi:hypothetical protein